MTKPSRISREELAREGATALPDKEVLSLLELNATLDLALDAAAPIDLAIGANANIAAPIEAAASANVLSPDAISAAEKSLLEGSRVIPLFHLPETYGAAPRVKGVPAITPLGEWRFENLWLESGRP